MARTLNPLRNAGTALPPAMLLVAKLMVLAFLLKGYVARLPDPWLPMVPVFDLLPDRGVSWVLQVVFGLAAMGLFLNVRVRLCAFLAGLVFFLPPLLSRVTFFFADFFGACILMLIGLWRAPFGMALIRAQLAVMYLGSGLNKLLDPDWRSGHFLDYWLSDTMNAYRYRQLDAHLPEGWLPLGLSWGSIAGELSLGALFCIPALSLAAVWSALLFHTGSVYFIQDDFGIFVILLVLSFVLFVDWPGPGAVEVRTGARLGPALRALSRWLHFDDVLRWTAATGGPALELVEDGRSRVGFAALNRWLLLSPVPYLVFTVLSGNTWLSKDARGWVLQRSLLVGIVWFFPLTPWLLNRLFRVQRPVVSPGSVP